MPDLSAIDRLIVVMALMFVAGVLAALVPKHS